VKESTAWSTPEERSREMNAPDFFEIAWRRALAVETTIIQGIGCATGTAGSESAERIELGPRILESGWDRRS
jgi:hypothetical protein